jgi:hypothetical protein
LFVFNGILLDGTKCSSDVVIPDSVKIIGGGAFDYCSSLESVTIPDSVTIIGDGAFASCNFLKPITIPDSVTSIGNDAFYACHNFESIIIPDSVTSIGGGAFGVCNSLESITILNPDCELFDSPEYHTLYFPYIASNTFSTGWGYAYNGVIKGYEGSTAQAYAEKYGFRFESLGPAPAKSEPQTPAADTIVYGDANLDGDATLSDALLILQFVANKNKYKLEGQALINADCCDAGDGVTPLDALAIQRLDAKIIKTLPTKSS